jgi:hypothetical protein
MTEDRLDLERILPKSRLQRMQERNQAVVKRLENVKKLLEAAIEELRRPVR